MASSGAVYQNKFVTQTEINQKVQGSDTKAMARTFFNEMSKVMQDYADQDSSMTVLGVTVSGEDKYGVIGTTLLNQFLNDNGNAVETIMSLQTFLNKLEQDISKVS